MERTRTEMGKINFGSFPRSGNHFFKHLTNCNWLNHRIQPLSIEKNVVVSIRNPLECIPSWIVATKDSRINRAEKNIEWYCAYYSKCKELDIVIIPFEQLISEPLHCINYVEKKYNLDLTKSLEYNLLTNFHSPTVDKSGYGIIVEEIINEPTYIIARSLFEELCVPVG
jgi:hypothetical protein